MSKRVLVVGAGLSGATIARLLFDKGYDVTVIERSATIGGNCKDYYHKGNLISMYGPHIFHTDYERVYELASKFTDFVVYNHKVTAFVGGSYVDLPINYSSIKDIYRNTTMDIDDLIDSLEKIRLYLSIDTLTLGELEKYANDKKIGSFRLRDLVKTLKKYIYEPYSIKQWGIKSLEELDKSILDRVPINLSWDNKGYFNDKYQLYPLKGYSVMIANMLKDIRVYTNIDFKSFTSVNHIEDFDYIIYTGSIDELFGFCYGKLPYRGVYFIQEAYNEDYVSKTFVTNYPDLSKSRTRTSDYSKLPMNNSFAPRISEFPLEADTLESRSYPKKDEYSLELYKKYKDLCDKDFKNKIKLLGRLGQYKYFDMDDAMMEAIKLFKEIENEQ